LVGIQIQNPRGQLLTIRTVNTGTNPTITPYVVVNAVFPCNASGEPQNSLKAGTLGYFKITVSNYDIEPRPVLMTINTYYQDNVPFGSASIETTLQGQKVQSTIISIPIPADATIGNATVYGNAYSGWPKLGGTPYCPEKSSQFQIISGASYQATAVLSNRKAEKIMESNGNYSMTIQLSPKLASGNYTVYVSSTYFSEESFNSTTFKIKLLGDLDNNGILNYWDAFLFRQAYLDGYNPDADLNFDGKIDYWDAFLFRQQYLKSA
jgi:hypothetical protein